MYKSKEEAQEDKRQRRKKRREILDAIKVESGCIDCGYRKHPAALHFDHREPSLKRFSVAHGIMRNWNIVLEEISKCDVRCANCHAIKTHS